MKKNLILILILCFNSYFFGQFNFAYKDSIPVKIGANELSLAWTGGLNYAQFSEIDFDFDGDMDLFIFDRSKDNIRLFEQFEDGIKKYRKVVNARNLFPPDLKNRIALLDYDLDGRNDMFCYGIGGVKVYKNTGNSNDGLSWLLISDLLYSDYDGTFTNLYVSAGDIPAYVDVDNDNDVDILTFNIGGDRMEYHQNQSRELYGHSDSLIFILKNHCWGTFTEDALTSDILLNATISPCQGGNVTNPQLHETETLPELGGNEMLSPQRHAGSTILALDYDNSGTMDLVIGDVNLYTLFLLINGGTVPNQNSPIVFVDQNFPSNTTPANVALFPAAFYIDVDFDLVKDLVVCPNAKGASENEHSVLFYKNIGTNEVPNFSFRTNSFMQEEMIEVGTGSIPILVDQNADGLNDLLVSNFYRYKEALNKESVISHYRNTGTINDPFFTFIESDYLGLSINDYGFRPVPTFGDLDSDGDLDVFFGMDYGGLVYRENIAGAGSQFNFAAPQLVYPDNLGNTIIVGNFAYPQLFDLNRDGLLDLIIGNKSGELKYYQNIGTSISPSFELVNDTLGNIDLAPTSAEGYTAPHFFLYNDTIRLLLGGFDGKVRFYDGIENNLQSGSVFNLISDNFQGINVEAYSSCAVTDMDNDGNLDLFVGGDLGGLYHLEHAINSTLSFKEKNIERKFSIYPNPNSGQIKIDNVSGIELQIKLFSLQGDLVYELDSFTDGTIELTGLQSGTYFMLCKDKQTGYFEMQKISVIQ